ncbi:MAG: hypothetical protein KBH43_00820 [Comamonas sp.]|nr:hypothetical protein [Comamonas sp.]
MAAFPFSDGAACIWRKAKQLGIKVALNPCYTRLGLKNKQKFLAYSVEKYFGEIIQTKG